MHSIECPPSGSFCTANDNDGTMSARCMVLNAINQENEAQPTYVWATHVHIFKQKWTQIGIE